MFGNAIILNERWASEWQRRKKIENSLTRSIVTQEKKFLAQNGEAPVCIRCFVFAEQVD